jgi:hypothetical protein
LAQKSRNSFYLNVTLVRGIVDDNRWVQYNPAIQLPLSLLFHPRIFCEHPIRTGEGLVNASNHHVGVDFGVFHCVYGAAFSHVSEVAG